VNVERLEPRRHDPPEGWSPEVFAAVTDAISRALVGAYRRAQNAEDTAEAQEAPGR
jgi:hypothetical protein